MKIQRFYTVREVSELLGGCSERTVKRRILAGEFGDVLRDAGGWLIPEAGLAGYLARHKISRDDIPAGLRPAPPGNLVQFRSS
jgi:hypothetical protein